MNQRPTILPSVGVIYSFDLILLLSLLFYNYGTTVVRRPSFHRVSSCISVSWNSLKIFKNGNMTTSDRKVCR